MIFHTSLNVIITCIITGPILCGLEGKTTPAYRFVRHTSLGSLNEFLIFYSRYGPQIQFPRNVNGGDLIKNDHALWKLMWIYFCMRSNYC